jgi:hypothetical protein
MRLGGEVEDGGGLVLGEDAGEEGGVGDVAVNEDVAGVGLEVGQVFGIARVGEGVEIDDGVAGGDGEMNEVRTDEASAPGDEEGSRFLMILDVV